MALFSVRTLGFPEIRRDEQPCRLALLKGLALLVYLAEAKGPVGRDVVATLLWPDSGEEVVRARLRRLMYRLQRALGDDVLATDRSTVRWSSAIDLQLDSQLFEQACDRGEFERACRDYSGDFLDGFSPGDCPQFDEWAFFRRETLRGRAIQALERVVHDRHAAGDYAAAAAHAGRLVQLDPLSEVYGRHLIRNLLLIGFPFRRWCYTVSGIAPFASMLAGISPAISRRRDSSNSTAPTIGPSRATSKPSSPASGNLSTVSQHDCNKTRRSGYCLGAECDPKLRAMWVPGLASGAHSPGGKKALSADRHSSHNESRALDT